MPQMILTKPAPALNPKLPQMMVQMLVHYVAHSSGVSLAIPCVPAGDWRETL
jgi:hypothetical protein